MNSQWRLIGLGVILLLIGVGARAIEEPAYTVVDQWQDGDIEVRSYEPRVWAVTQMDQSQNQGQGQENRALMPLNTTWEHHFPVTPTPHHTITLPWYRCLSDPYIVPESSRETLSLYRDSSLSLQGLADF